MHGSWSSAPLRALQGPRGPRVLTRRHPRGPGVLTRWHPCPAPAGARCSPGSPRGTAACTGAHTPGTAGAAPARPPAETRGQRAGTSWVMDPKFTLCPRLVVLKFLGTLGAPQPQQPQRASPKGCANSSWAHGSGAGEPVSSERVSAPRSRDARPGSANISIRSRGKTLNASTAPCLDRHGSRGSFVSARPAQPRSRQTELPELPPPLPALHQNAKCSTACPDIYRAAPGGAGEGVPP